MRSIKNILRAATFGFAIVAAAAVPTKNAQAADRGDVIAGIAGGLLVGTLFAAAANASNNNYAPQQTYTAPAQTYAPAQQYYAPAQTYSAPAQTYYAPAPVQQTYYAPAPTYYAPAPRYYAPAPVTLSFGFSSGRHYGHRRHYRGHKHRHYRGHKHRHHRRHRRGHRH